MSDVRILATGFGFPEGPVAMPDGSVILTEIRNNRCSRVAPDGKVSLFSATGGGPNGATEVTSILIFFEAFTRLRLGHATAMAWILGSLLIGITVIQLQRLSRMEFKTAK